jgi:hypothetical protein
MLRLLFTISAICITVFAQAQHVIVADALTAETLPFATIKQSNGQGIITDINGRFMVPGGITSLQASYIGHISKTVSSPFPDTIFLQLQTGTMQEVVIKPPYEKIKAIINNAIRSKPTHNPEKYEQYSCAVYYKMTIDLVPNGKSTDTADRKNLESFLEKSHLLFAETYSKRYYQKPNRQQEIILASRFSGLSKTYFTNLVTDILPFHVYGDFIELNKKDYIHPVAAGWQQRYNFDLIDEVPEGTDTIYILKYKPKKNALFNSLYGTVYIHSKDFAISHIIANTTNPVDSATNRYVKLEQIYHPVNGKWFPQELNYEMTFKEYPSKDMGMLWKGHCIVDSVSFAAIDRKIFDKVRPVKLSDSVDTRTREEWNSYRFDTLQQKEQNTYTVIDSLSAKAGTEKVINAFRNAGHGMLSLGYVDVELKRLLSLNPYEGTRLGLGLFTNDKISKYVSVGGWFGYGIKDKEWKYGASARLMPRGQKDNWLELAYQNNYKGTGSTHFHKELDDAGLRQWTLSQVDRIEEYAATLHCRLGFYELELNPLVQKLEPQYTYNFTEPGTNGRIFNLNEVSVGIRYAYGEIRTPAFGYYIPASTKYPIAYLRISGGQLTSGSYEAQYIKTLAAITYNVHTNRWGRDYFRLEGGMVKTIDDKALPRSYLLAGNGYRMNKNFQLYTNVGLVTLLPYQYFSDKYASLMYRHDFDRALFQVAKVMKPTPAIAHNMLYGSMDDQNAAANTGAVAPTNGYHESGIIMNKILISDIANFAYVNFNIGAFYHWAPGAFDWKSNGRVTFALSFEL